jgi:hypothetical protein
MLSRRLSIEFEGLEVAESPMMIPSLSSRANVDVPRFLEAARGFLKGPLLVSAYDVRYSENFPKLDFPEIVILDSGGYECSQDQEISDIGLYRPQARGWSADEYSSVLDDWHRSVPTVAVSYDDPLSQLSIDEQINAATDFFRGRDGLMKEMLLKAPRGKFISADSLTKSMEMLSEFHFVGVTEKQLGESVLDRMTTLASLRMKMEQSEVKRPIHVFGSLDPVTTPLYYFSGADMFDGLAWLRFSLTDEGALYVESSEPKKRGIERSVRDNWMLAVKENCSYLADLRLRMIRFSRSNDFDVFGQNSGFFKNSFELLKSRMGGVI